jgi:hypothetical protein
MRKFYCETAKVAAAAGKFALETPDQCVFHSFALAPKRVDSAIHRAGAVIRG